MIETLALRLDQLLLKQTTTNKQNLRVLIQQEMDSVPPGYIPPPPGFEGYAPPTFQVSTPSTIHKKKLATTILLIFLLFYLY